MTHLTDTQLILLAAAAARDDQRLILPDRLRGGAADVVLTALATKGLIEPVDEPSHPVVGGFRAGEPGTTRFIISQAGLTAIHADEEDDGGSGTKDRLLAAHPGRGNDGDPPQPGLPDTAGEAALEKPQPCPADIAASGGLPRPGSKLASVVALLARPEGASIDELGAATKWLPHTIRAALTGLRKRSLAVSRTNDSGTARYRLAVPASASAMLDSEPGGTDRDSETGA